MAQQRHRLDGRIALEDRQQHRLPDRAERIGDSASAFDTAELWQPRVGLDASCGAFAEACAGGGGALAVTGGGLACTVSLAGR
jgi:hypothetical protein